MKIIISKNDFHNGIKLAEKILQVKNLVPAYENFLFKAGENDLLYITAASEDGSLTTCAPCKIEKDKREKSSFTINAKLLLNSISELDNQPLIIETISNFEATITYNNGQSNGKFHLTGIAADEFPNQYENSSEGTQRIIRSMDLRNGISLVQFCAAGDELRPILCGTLIEQKNKKLTFVSSNGHQLARKEYNYPDMEDFSFVLPKLITKIIPSILPGDESNTEITVFSSHIQIKHNYFTLDCRLIEGKYPNYQSVIPENNDKFLFVNRGIIISALKRVLLFSDSFSSLIALNLSTEKTFLFAQNIDSPTSAKEEIESTFDSSKPMEIGFNGRYLLEILTAMPSEEIKMTFSYPEKAGIIKADREDDLLYLLMPSMVAQ